MIHPTPPGTRDILPDEMRELRALEAALVDAFEELGYGEVATPTIEYEEVLARGDERGARPPTGSSTSTATLLAMRSDMTVPIARLVATRLRRRRAAVPALLHRHAPTARFAPSAARCASSPRRESSWSGPRRRRARPR